MVTKIKAIKLRVKSTGLEGTKAKTMKEEIRTRLLKTAKGSFMVRP